MTKMQLRFQTGLMVLYLLSLLLAAYIDKLYLHLNIYDFIKDFSSIFIAAAAAYLTYCYSRKQAHVASLRELWKQAILSKGDLIQYTHCETFSREQYGKAYNSISTTIDFVRSVYKNVGETEEAIGLFPFEPLHDMRKCLQRIGFVNVQPETCSVERGRMMVAWNAFRCNFLKEFQTPKPPHSITKPDAEDPRRPK